METNTIFQNSGCRSRSEQYANITSYIRKEAEHFLELVFNYQTSLSSTERQAVEKILSESFSRDAVQALMCLLRTADESTVCHFACTQLFPSDAAQDASVSVVILPNPNAHSGWGNMGRFYILTQKEEGQATSLHFTNQASAVYYLMFLIHRLQGKDNPAPVSLSKNRETFIRLYHQVYDIADWKLRERVEHLLHREVDGNMRAGRQGDLRRDIRKHLEDAFLPYNESFQPYAMTARKHLTVPPRLIRFEGEAQRLLEFNFI